MKIKRIVGVALAGGLAAASWAAVAPSAQADLDATYDGIQLVQCTESSLIASLNPPIKDGDATGNWARYIKAASKRSDGTKFTFANTAIPPDTTSCDIDAGIRTNVSDIDLGTGKYNLDDQVGGAGNATITLQKLAATFVGSSQCDASVSDPPKTDYPRAYPLQGKLVYKFNEFDQFAKQIQMQVYARIYGDDDDPGVYHVTGTVIKGPGVGGRSTSAFAFLPTNSTKNVNVVAGCTNGASFPGDASAAELWILGVDSLADADTNNETLNVTIGDDDANELLGP